MGAYHKALEAFKFSLEWVEMEKNEEILSSILNTAYQNILLKSPYQSLSILNFSFNPHSIEMIWNALGCWIEMDLKLNSCTFPKKKRKNYKIIDFTIRNCSGKNNVKTATKLL